MKIPTSSLPPVHPASRFTASRYAAKLGISPRAFRLRIRGVAPDGTVIVRGQEAEAWSFDVLPEEMREELRLRAKRLGYRDVLAYLNDPVAEWKPSIPLSEVAQAHINKARQLRSAFESTFARLPDLTLSNGEFNRLGVEDYGRIVGHAISERQWCRIFHRIWERDDGAENWSRLELYLPERIGRRAEYTAPSNAPAEFRELLDYLQEFHDPLKPSPAEQSGFWHRACQLFFALVDAGKAERKLRRRLLRFLWQSIPNAANWLATSPDALRVNLARKLDRFRIHDGAAAAFADGRRKKKGEPRAEPFEQDSLDKITFYAVENCGGRVSQAVRELAEKEALDPQIQTWFLSRFASKSYVLHRLRAAVSTDVRALLPHHQGPRAAEKMLPSLDLNYDGIYSMTALQADDFTMPVYMYVPDGQGWFRLTRGQVLVVIDFRSLCILGFCLYPEAQYHAGLIRTVFTRVFGERGLPSILYLERGIWQRSKLVTGGPQANRLRQERDMPFSLPEIEQGLGQYGVRFIHARRARSKPVERVGGLLQDLMEGERGYCGREEKKDAPESLRRQMAEVMRKTDPVHPSKYFYSLDEWEQRFAEICERYNAARQDGKRLNGLSPEAAFHAFENTDDPPSRFDASCRYLLALHRKPVDIKPTGEIVFSIRGETFKYFSEETGKRKGQRVIAWFNPELPDLLTVSDENLRNAFTVERHHSTNALRPDNLYQDEVAKVRACAAHAKARYRVLKLKFGQTFRPNVVDPRTVKLGQRIEHQQQAAESRRVESSRRHERVRRKSDALGIPAALLGNATPEALEALEALESARRQQSNSEPSPSL